MAASCFYSLHFLSMYFFRTFDYQMFKRVQGEKTKRDELKDVGSYVNKQRTLVFSTRGILHRDRHLMTDLRDLLPHSRKDVKFDLKGM